MRNRWLSALVALVLAVGAGIIATPAVAQTTGDIEGTVSDQNGAPLPGVTVELRSPALLGTRTTVTDSAGRYRFPALPPGTYTVTSSLSGFTKAERTGVVVALGRTATIPLTMSVSVKEEVVVTGEAPVVDITRTTIGTTASADEIQKLPLGRNYVSVATTAAGTGTDAAGGVTVYGATSLENQYVIDGVNTTGVKIGDQGKTLNQEFVQEVEVKTGGYEAEYGRALGGVINVITKSGGNEFHGDGFGYYDSKNLAAKDSHQADRNAVNGSQFFQPKRWDFGADLGGYFVKDRLWFFGAYDRVNRDQEYDRVDSLTYTVPPAPNPVTATSNLVHGTDSTRTNIFSGKLTFRLGESNTIAASVFGDPGTVDGRISTARGPASEVLGTTDVGGTDVSAKYDGIFGTQVLAQAQYGHHEDSNRQHSAFANQLAVIAYRNGLTVGLPGSGPAYLVDERYKRDAGKASATLFAGFNEIKGGVDYESLNSTFNELYGGGERILQFLGTRSGQFNYAYHRYFATVPLNCTMLKSGATGNFGPVGPGTDPNTCAAYQESTGVQNNPKTRNLALFLQDSAKILPNLTINAGIRWEQQKLLDAGGNTAIKLDNEWSPRVGIVWDPLANGRSKIYASYGRFYEIIPQDIQTRALGNEYTVFAYNYTAAQRDPTTDPAFFAYGDPTIQGGELVQAGLKGMYSDEVIGGIEYEFLTNWSFGLKGIYKALGRAVEDRCDLQDPRVNLSSFLPAGALTTCALVNVGQGNALGNIKDPGNPACFADYPADTVPTPCASIQARRYYRGVEADVTHRFASNFYMLASYVYSKLEGNYSGNLSQTRETGQEDPNINADFDYIDLTPNNFGRLRNDRKHQLKVSGLYSFPFGLQVGVNSSWNSGRPMSIRGYARPGYSQERYLIARGSWYDLPSYYDVDLHLEYGLRLGQVTISPVADIFNLTNVQKVTSREELYCSSKGGCASLGVGPFGTNITPPPTSTKGTAASPNFNKDVAWETPRVIRLGARVSF